MKVLFVRCDEENRFKFIIVSMNVTEIIPHPGAADLALLKIDKMENFFEESCLTPVRLPQTASMTRNIGFTAG